MASKRVLLCVALAAVASIALGIGWPSNMDDACLHSVRFAVYLNVVLKLSCGHVIQGESRPFYHGRTCKLRWSLNSSSVYPISFQDLPLINLIIFGEYGIWPHSFHCEATQCSEAASRSPRSRSSTSSIDLSSAERADHCILYSP